MCARVSQHQRLVAGFPWVFVSRCLHACPRAAVVCSVSDCVLGLCVLSPHLSSTPCLPAAVSRCLSPCLLQRVSVTGFCGSVYVSDALGLPISVPVCHCVCPPMCHHLPRCPVCFTHHPGHRWACQAHWCPELRPSPSHPRPAMGQAGRLFAMPAPGKHQDPERKGHLPHLHSLPLSLPWTGLAQSPTGGTPKLEMCPDLSPTHGPPPSQAPSLGLCLPACLLFVAPWLSAGFSASFCPHFLSPAFLCGSFSGMTLVFILSHLPWTLSVFSQGNLISLLSWSVSEPTDSLCHLVFNSGPRSASLFLFLSNLVSPPHPEPLSLGHCL